MDGRPEQAAHPRLFRHLSRTAKRLRQRRVMHPHLPAGPGLHHPQAAARMTPGRGGSGTAVFGLPAPTSGGAPEKGMASDGNDGCPRQEGRPGGSGHRQLRGFGEGPPERLHAPAESEGHAARDLGRQAVHRGRALPRAEPDASGGPAHRRRRERRQRLPRPRRIARAGRLPHLQRQRQEPDRRAGRAGRDEMEEDRAGAVRHEAWRRARHRHAGGAEGLLPRSRPQRLRGPVGLGEGDHASRAQPRVPDEDGRRQSGE